MANSYTILFKNNSSNEVYRVDKAFNHSINHLYLEFRDIDLELPEGEYTYACFLNDRDDIVYDYKADLMESVLDTAEGKVKLKDLHPATGLMRVGAAPNKAIMDNKTKTFIFYGE